MIIDSQPLTVALLASLLFGEQLSAVGVGGLALGITGLCLLEVPPDLLQTLLTEGPAGTFTPSPQTPAHASKLGGRV